MSRLTWITEKELAREITNEGDKFRNATGKWKQKLPTLLANNVWGRS